MFPRRAHLPAVLFGNALAARKHRQAKPRLEITGKVVKVSDGDMLQILHEGRPVKIRLAGIDAPEKSQPFGKKAREYAADLAAGKILRAEILTKDRYGRSVGEVFLENGQSLNREMVRAGYAWWYRVYSKDRSLGELEACARAARQGLWRDARPEPPWEFRKHRRSGRKAGKTDPAQPGLLESLHEPLLPELQGIPLGDPGTDPVRPPPGNRPVPGVPGRLPGQGGNPAAEQGAHPELREPAAPAG